MFFPLFIVALLGTASCHVTRNYDSAPGNAQYGNVHYGNGSEPAAFAEMNEVPGTTTYISLSYTTNTSVMTAVSNADCKDLGFDINLDAIQATFVIKGEWCSPAENDEWSLTLDSKLKIIGIQLSNERFTFSPRQSEFRRNIHLGLAKADFRIGVYDLCIKIMGEGCYWAGNWHCGDFYHVLHCFKSQNFYSTYLRSNTARYIESDDCPSRMRQIAALAHSDEL